MRGFRLVLLAAVAVARLRPIAAAAAMLASAAMMLPVAGMALAVLPASSLALATLLRLATLIRLTALVLATLLRFTALLLAALILRAAAEIIAFALAFAAALFLAFEARTEAGTVGGVSGLSALSAELLLRRHDDAVVMLGVLKITLRPDEIAGCHRIARERGIFLGDMRGRPADFHIRAVRFEAAREWILGLTATTAASPAIILLSLPHRPVFNPNKRSMPRSFFTLKFKITFQRHLCRLLAYIDDPRACELSSRKHLWSFSSARLSVFFEVRATLMSMGG